MKAEKLRSIADIARIAGVSKSTVSRALNDSPLVGDETKQRISAIAEEHHFQPSVAARNLSLKSSHTIAFVTHTYSKEECGISDPFSLEIMGGITIGLHERGYDMLVVHVDPSDRGWAAQFLDSGRVDGFILMTSAQKSSHVDLLLSVEAPFVAWGPPVKTGYCTVRGDDFRGGMLAAERFAGLGRSRVGFIGGARAETEVQERQRGFAAGLASRGLALQPDLTLYADYMEKTAAKATTELLQRQPRLDAVFAGSDIMAIAAMRTLQAMGRRIPDDVAVIGYDDLSLASYVTPTLTTISQKVPLAGKLLAEALVTYLEKRIITTTTVPVELIVRSSA
jgi:DNA-binding LacI/PurR family transcriptional regulator